MGNGFRQDEDNLCSMSNVKEWLAAGVFSSERKSQYSKE